jgi:hypothetical protein
MADAPAQAAIETDPAAGMGPPGPAEAQGRGAFQYSDDSHEYV